MALNLNWIKCKFGIHRPSKRAKINKSGYFHYARCSVCRREIIRDMHWESDGKWDLWNYQVGCSCFKCVAHFKKQKRSK